MTDHEVIENLKVEYYGTLEAAQRDDEANHTNHAAHFITFYEFLLKRGFSRQKLSVLEVSKEAA